MRLFALRGANSVEANEASAILDATDRLIREMMTRNALDADAMVIRVLMHYYAPEGHQPRHVYLGEARLLRTDIESAQ